MIGKYRGTEKGQGTTPIEKKPKERGMIREVKGRRDCKRGELPVLKNGRTGGRNS